MKKLLPFIMVLVLAVFCAGCGSVSSKTSPAPTTPTPETKTEAGADTPVPAGEAPAPEKESGSTVLVAYFSATGTTRGVAEKLAAITGADLYEIIPAEPYSNADLDYNDANSRTTKEQNDKSARPVIGSEAIDLSGYETVYIGFPIWWGEEPRILDTFVEQYDFTGKTLIPFCTSGGSGIGRSGSNLEELAGKGTWLTGTRHNGNISESDLQSWIAGLQ